MCTCANLVYNVSEGDKKVTTTVQSAPRPRGGVVHPVYASPMQKDAQGMPVAVDWDQSYVGCVLMTYERNGYDDSDFYAVVYDEATDSINHVEYASTRGWTYMDGATVDATEDVKAKAREVIRRQAFARMTAAAADAAKAPEVGKAVVVTAGRKVPQGTTGSVVWKGEDSYANARNSRYAPAGFPRKTAYRVGIKTAEGTVFTAGSNVTVVDPQEYMPDWAQVEAEAARYAKGDHWRQY
jgi:hypothetical protein